MEERSRRRARLILIVGLLLALGAGAGTYFYASSASSAVPPPVQTTDVVVAAREIPLRTIVTAADVRVAKYNADVAPPGALSRSADVVGRIVMQPVSVGEPLLPSKFAAADGKPWTVFPVGEEITPTSPHYRVMTITVVDQFAVGGTIMPGEIVDVMYTFSLDPLKFFEEDEDAPEDAPEMILDATAKIILERMIVLDRAGQVYTIRTDAETAEKLAYLQTSGGQMWLLLRAVDDQRSAETTGATFGPVYETYGFRVPEKVSP